MQDLVHDHASVERLLEEGAIRVKAMSAPEVTQIFKTAESLFQNGVWFHTEVVNEISKLCSGYPYLAQLIGKECVHVANRRGVVAITPDILDEVKSDIREGKAFPTLDSQYTRAIGDSAGRKYLLHFLAEQEDDVDLLDEELGKVQLRKLRADVSGLGIENIDQLIPRLIDKKFGPVLYRHPEKPGVYEFENPVLRLYIRLRNM